MDVGHSFVAVADNQAGNRAGGRRGGIFSARTVQAETYGRKIFRPYMHPKMFTQDFCGNFLVPLLLDDAGRHNGGDTNAPLGAKSW